MPVQISFVRILDIFNVLAFSKTHRLIFCGILEDDILWSKLRDNKNASINIKSERNF